ncbi:MAG: diguanylate cyclase domain-containing protein [Thermosynechococcaceae cyanobacterium]
MQLSDLNRVNPSRPDDDEPLFSDEADPVKEVSATPETFANGYQAWNVIIIDDEPAVHQATQLALKNFTFADKPLVFLSAYSAAEGQTLLSEKHLETAFVLLDVVMETHDAGLQVVQYIRNHLNNHQLRIILRTGHPGEAPEESVILDYDINDYKLKVELTRQKLRTTVITTLRSYRDIVCIEEQRQELAQTLDHLEEAQRQLQEYSYTLELKVSERTAALEDANQQLRGLAMLDGLTQVPNRRHLDEYLLNQWSCHRRQQQPLSLIMIDVDYFKLYNDLYGHLIGDECLQKVAQAIDQTIKRSTDFVARYGGEEFTVVLPFTGIQGAGQVAKNIMAKIQGLQIPHASSPIGDQITLSMGLTSLVPQPEQSLKDLIQSADEAMYRAKQAGRNQLCLCPPASI